MNDLSYMQWVSMSDRALAQVIGKFIKHHRLEQNKTQEEVSVAAAISRSTLGLLERGETVTLNTLLKVLRVLDLLHILDVFKVENEISPIAYAKLKDKKRHRASPGKKKAQTKGDSEW